MNTVVRKGTRKSAFDPKDFLSAEGDDQTISKYQKDQKIFSQGDLANAVFYIRKGKVKITVVSEEGKEGVLAILEPDEFFGESCLGGHMQYLTTATAMTECEIVSVDKATMVRAFHEQPQVREKFISHLLARTVRVEEDLADQLLHSSEKRLARILLLLAHFNGAGGSERVIEKISHGVLAEMVGTTRSRVTQFMNKFRKMGLIDYNGELKIRPLLSVVLHDRPPSE